MYKNLFKKTFCNLTNMDPILTKTMGLHNNIYFMYLNNPKKKNALSSSLLDSIKKNIITVNKSTNIRAVVLLSKEPGFFCAGADLKEREKMTEEDIETVEDYKEVKQSEV